MTSRRAFFVGLFGCCSASVLAQGPIKKWYIVGGHTEDKRGYRDDCTVPPLVCYGRDRIDALTNSGITVMEASRYGDYWNEPSCRKARGER